MTDLTHNSIWTLITIDDPDMVCGDSIHDLIKILSDVFKFKFAITDDIVGSGKRDWVIDSLQNRSDEVIQIDELLKITLDVSQLDWGDFFLFKNYPKHWDNQKKALYPYVIIQSDTTVRAVDNQYFYIYTPDENVAKLIQLNYEIESIKTGNLDDLDFPE